jgi:hypothetical protein
MIDQKNPIPDLFRFTLYPSDTLTGTSLVLTNAPDGWQGMVSTWARDEKYNGIYRKIETQLRFIREGADWLLLEYEKNGVGAQSRITIEQLDYDTLKYKINFEGEFNFAEYSDITDTGSGENIVDIAITETGIINLLRAQEGKVQEIPFPSVPPMVNIIESANAYQRASMFFSGDMIGSGRVPDDGSIIAIMDRDSEWPSSDFVLFNNQERTGREIFFQPWTLIRWKNPTSETFTFNVKLTLSIEWSIAGTYPYSHYPLWFWV